MTRNEALKAAIDGKKVRLIEWGKNQYLYFDSLRARFYYFDGNEEFATNSMAATDIRNPHGTWQIVPEYVDFAEAWKAYEEGKTIQSAVSYDKYNKKQEQSICFMRFCRKEIRGKWLILEDE